MTWTQSIFLFLVVNFLGIGLMVLPYYIAVADTAEVAMMATVPT